MKKRILLAAIIFFALALARAENIFSSEAIYGPKEVQAKLVWSYLGPWWLSCLQATTDGEFFVGMGLSFPEVEFFDYNSFEAVLVDFRASAGLVFTGQGLAEDYYYIAPVVEFRDWEERFFLRTEQIARFTEDNLGWWDTNNQVFFRTGRSFFGGFIQTHHEEIFAFSFFGPLFKQRVSQRLTIETFLGINPEKAKMGGARIILAIP